MIEVAPELAAGASKPTDQAVAAARAKADQALADLKAGKDWETVAKSVSTDASKEQAGDLGFIDKDSTLDAAFLAGLLAAVQGRAHRGGRGRRRQLPHRPRDGDRRPGRGRDPGAARSPTRASASTTSAPRSAATSPGPS